MGRLPREHTPLDAPDIVCIAPGCRERTGFNVFCSVHRELPFSDRMGMFAVYLRQERIRRKQRPGDAELLARHLETADGQRTLQAIDAALGRDPVLTG